MAFAIINNRSVVSDTEWGATADIEECLLLDPEPDCTYSIVKRPYGEFIELRDECGFKLGQL